MALSRALGCSPLAKYKLWLRLCAAASTSLRIHMANKKCGDSAVGRPYEISGGVARHAEPLYRISRASAMGKSRRAGEAGTRRWPNIRRRAAL